MLVAIQTYRACYSIFFVHIFFGAPKSTFYFTAGIEPSPCLNELWPLCRLNAETRLSESAEVGMSGPRYGGGTSLNPTPLFPTTLA
jgi:hypothetical protein